MKIVVKISGKYFTPINSAYAEELASVLKEIQSRENRIAVVVGGGKTARDYIKPLRELGVNEGHLDLLGIRASRLNAYALTLLLGESAYPEIPGSIEEFLEYWATGRMVVAGGFQPGQSTNAVSALIAEAITASTLYNMTNVDGVYTDDPKRNPNAVKLDELTVSELKKILSRKSANAGTYELFDGLSLDIIERSKIQVVVLDGSHPINLIKHIRGERIGTLIKPD
ncbi:MAG: UMP kinase [Desulfurococcales archaeon]|nr:UMP kinase [Desulfurococcales archaeon]